MINASKSREIATRANYNLYDEQLRNIFELIEEAAKCGEFSLTFRNDNCKNFGIDYTFWFEGARLHTDIWEKVKKVLTDMEYEVKYEIINYPDQKITIAW